MTSRSFALATLAAALAISAGSGALAAGGVVGAGTAASCTEAAFDVVFNKAQSSGGGVITFNCGGAPHAIVFGLYKPVATNTEIQGGDLITLSGNNVAGLFQVFAAGTLKLSNLVVTRGYGSAGAIENFGRLTITNARLEGNTATVAGGAVTNHADATLSNVVVTGNEAAMEGGGIFADGGITRITNSQITANRGQRGAGVAVAGGAVEIDGSTIARNFGNSGGGVYLLSGSVSLLRTVVSANTAPEGAGIMQRGGTFNLNEVIIANNGDFASGNGTVEGGGFNQELGTAVFNSVSVIRNSAFAGAGILASGGTTALTNVTISGNDAKAELGGGSSPGLYVRGGNVTLTNVTITGNLAAPTQAVVERQSGTIAMKSTVLANGTSKNCKAPLAAAVAVATFSYSSDGTCAFGGPRDNAVLPFEPLATNGGFTLTQMPLAGSPVIDNGAGLGCPAVDQRGVTRPSGVACDAGAVEYVAGAPGLATVFEYFNAGFGHYFVTVLTDEIAKLDSGAFVGWTRTGQQFNVYRNTGSNLAPVCRFFTLAFPPKSSHFYAPRGFGCEGTLQNRDWQFEGDVFYTPLPNASAQCPAGHLPVYRLYNNGQGGAPNHRFTVDPVLRAQMVASGYVGEGAGIGVGMCSPQ